MNLAHLVTASTRWELSAPAVWLGDRRVDYLALEMSARRIATIARERYGIGPGDRVAVMLPDVPELAFVYYGILWAGAVVVVLDPELDPDVVAVRLRDSEAGLLIAWHALAEAAERVSMIGAIECLFVEPREFSRLLAGVSPRVALDDRDAGAPAVLVYSSAGAIPADRVAFTHGELIAGARRLARSASLEPADIVLCAPSLGLEIDPGFAMNAVVETGASLVLLGDRPTPALTAASTEKATVLIGEAGAIAALFAAGRGARKTTAVPRIFVPVGASRPSELNVEPREVDQMTFPKASAAS